MAKHEKVSCKKILDQTVCKVGSAVVLPQKPVTVHLYNTPDCNWCEKEIDAFSKRSKKLSGFVKPVVSDINDVQGIDMSSLGVFPVADFGNGIIEKGRISKMNERDIIGRAIESIRAGDVIRSFHGE